MPSLFSSTDEKYHARYRRCVNNAFSMSSLVSYEPLVESTLAIFLSQTEKLFEQEGKTCNFGRWLQFFAFDVIGELTWSKRVGFVEKNEDVDGIVDFIGKFLEYAGPVGARTLEQRRWYAYSLFRLGRCQFSTSFSARTCFICNCKD